MKLTSVTGVNYPEPLGANQEGELSCELDFP
jgi:hypothetical protein